MLRQLLCVLCLLASSSAFLVGSPGRHAMARPQSTTRCASCSMGKSKEDLEFEEWVRKKKLAAGVDPDEDFGTGRKAEKGIYLAGGENSQMMFATASHPLRSALDLVCTGLVTVLVPIIAGTWAYQNGYLTPQ